MAKLSLWLIRVLKLEKIDQFFWHVRNQPRRIAVAILGWIGMLGTVFSLVVGLAVLGLVWRMNTNLPSYEHLENYQPSVMTRIYAENGTLLAEHAKQNRLFVPYREVPPQLINALVATEDKSFWTHPGIDMRGIARAAVMNVSHVVKGRRLVGGSTITQQVARNFLLTHRVRLERKIKEILLALRLERALPKEKIMELYVNEIYLGPRLLGCGIGGAELFWQGAQ